MMNFIWMIVIGLVAGFLARAIKPGDDSMSLVMTMILGIAGALVGGFLSRFIGLGAEGGFTGLIFSVIGAIILLFIYELIAGRRKV